MRCPILLTEYLNVNGFEEITPYSNALKSFKRYLDSRKTCHVFINYCVDEQKPLHFRLNFIISTVFVGPGTIVHDSELIYAGNTKECINESIEKFIAESNRISQQYCEQLM